MLKSLILGLSIFGGLFGGGSDGGACRESAAQAARTLKTVERQWPLRAQVDPVSRYVAALGQRVARAGGDSGESLAFHVLRNLEPTAFALGGGQFVVSDGLIAMVDREDELAAVLAHELSHQHLGHFCRERGDAATRRIRLGGVVQHFDLDREIAADAAAVELLKRAGFNPAAMDAVLRCLARRPGAAVADLGARREALARFAASTTAEQPEGPANGDFEPIRKHVIEELGGAVKPCH